MSWEDDDSPVEPLDVSLELAERIRMEELESRVEALRDELFSVLQIIEQAEEAGWRGWDVVYAIRNHIGRFCVNHRISPPP